jgi:hypothetical protein
MLYKRDTVLLKTKENAAKTLLMALYTFFHVGDGASGSAINSIIWILSKESQVTVERTRKDNV